MTVAQNSENVTAGGRPASSSVRSDWVFVLLVIAGVLLVTALPYAYAYTSAPAGQKFMGIMIDVPDHTQYFAWLRGLSSANLTSNTLTPEPNAPVFFNLLWWMLGQAGRVLGWDYAAMFQVLRVVATTAFLILLYRLCAWFLPERRMARTAFLVAIFTSGFGWVLVALKYLLRIDYPLPISLLIYIVEPNTFFAILSTPHLVDAALYMFTFDLILRGEIAGRYRYALAAGLFAQFMGWQHAYDLFLTYGVLGAYGLLKLLRDRRMPRYLLVAGLIVGALSVWPGLYSFLLTSLDPIWRQVLAQFDNAGVYTPSLLWLPVLMGPAFLLALFTQFKDKVYRLRALDDKALFLVAWFWANFLLIYLPTNYQIKMLNGWQVPIALLATQGLYKYILPAVSGWLSGRGRVIAPVLQQRLLAAALLVAVLPTNLYLWAWRFTDLSRHDYPYYLHNSEVAGLDWLAQNHAGPEVVLASLTVGQYVPALTGQRAFLAHWAQTVDYYTKESLVTEFFNPATADLRRQAILKRYDVRYVFYGPAERALGGYNPGQASFLRSVFTSADVTVYQVL